MFRNNRKCKFMLIFSKNKFNMTRVNSLWPNHPIWGHRTWSTLAQVMACCLTAPSHYLNQCWLFISKVQSHSSGNHFTKDTSANNHWNQFENYLSKFSFKSPRGQWVNWALTCWALWGPYLEISVICPIWSHITMSVKPIHTQRAVVTPPFNTWR